MILKASKENAVKAQGEYKRQLEQLQGEIGIANSRLHSQKLSSQKLAMEFERVRSERDAMEAQLENSTSTSVQGHSEQDFQAAQAKVKALTSETSRQVTTIRNLKEDVCSLEEKLKKANERVSHVERDLQQKRTLMDDMRLKMKLHQENAQSDADMLMDAEDKLKAITEINGRFKTQLDSFKQRITAVTREKYENEEKVIKLSEELDKKSKIISELQRKSSELERTLIAMETTAQQQLHQLANQSEEAIDTAQSRLVQANHRLREFNKFLKVLSHSLLNSTKQARSLLEQHQLKPPVPVAPSFDTISLKKAQNKACDILNLSLSDIDDMLSVSGESTQKDTTLSDSYSLCDEKKGKKWSRKWEKLLQINEEFSLPLAELFMEKVDERCKLAGALQMI
ncbi:hypothetical protein CAPTEDRAFT_226236 [Capitella teleta]|uniref:Uncharacterized protein n=1 Tax=Capitella teleta TaxID=283909 RepID=R7TZH1_CAPTE|nr:hypothetical protein CAPTEDRAFT_226236 [Capitella teleta]|eukprot:ELT99338.1 hypothetical protein CAPTEDRAFT_226236 [Capitella teleta]